jgi:hypothetical protein
MAVAGPAKMELRAPVPLYQHEQQATDKSVMAQNVNSLPLDNMLRIRQQFITEFSGAVSEVEIKWPLQKLS